MDITSLQAEYRSGTTTPAQEIVRIYDQIEREGLSPVWISVVDREQALAAARKMESDPQTQTLPLYGVPFAVKDNIDVVGMETTAACPGFLYRAQASAPVVEHLLAAGAMLIGKTNMDQFATGLVGVRSPYGACSSIFDPEYVSGGSSSGSAVAVARGLVSFALGTDTAGSGRVPAAFNNLVGLKPTRGLLSARGVVPACRSLDCVSILAETCDDARRVLAVTEQADAADGYSRSRPRRRGAGQWPQGTLTRIGIPTESSLRFFGDDASRAAFERAVKAAEAIGAKLVPFDYAPFASVAELLYAGPWVAERLAAIESALAQKISGLDPTVETIIRRGAEYSAVDAFRAAYRLKELEQTIAPLWHSFDCILLPTAGTHYRITEVLANPIELNSNLGYYTNFVNLLDLAAVAVPAGFKPSGLPFGVTLVGQPFSETSLLATADQLSRSLGATLGGSTRPLVDTPPVVANPLPGHMPIAVVGAHLTGEPLNYQLTERGARLLAATTTAPDYRLYSLAETQPPKPGLMRVAAGEGTAIDVEVWAMPEETVGSFLALIPAPLGLGTIRLADGSQCKGFICEPEGFANGEEISSWGGWRAYLRSRSARPPAPDR